MADEDDVGMPSRWKNLDMTPNEDKIEEYAEFLRKAERACGPQGFIDSKRYQQPYIRRNMVKKKTLQQQKQSDDIMKPKHLRATSHSAAELSQSQSGTTPKLSRARTTRYDPNRVIEVVQSSLIKSKSDERELKRLEGSYIKKQQLLRAEIRKVDAEITKHKQTVQSQMVKRDKVAILDNQHFVKARFKGEKINAQSVKKLSTEFQEVDRAAELTTGALQTKLSILEKELVQVIATEQKIAEEMNRKLAATENRQRHLKKEMLDTALALEMESAKAAKIKAAAVANIQVIKQKKIDEEKNLQTSTEAYENTKQQEGRTDFSTLAVCDVDRDERALPILEAQREYTRRLLTVRQTLDLNANTQSDLTTKAWLADLGIKAAQREENVDVHVKKAQKKIEEWTEQRHQQRLKLDDESAKRFKVAIVKQELADTEQSLAIAEKYAKHSFQNEKSVSDNLRKLEMKLTTAEQQKKKLFTQLIQKQKETDDQLQDNLRHDLATERRLTEKLGTAAAQHHVFLDAREEMRLKLNQLAERHRLDQLETHRRADHFQHVKRAAQLLPVDGSAQKTSDPAAVVASSDHKPSVTV